MKYQKIPCEDCNAMMVVQTTKRSVYYWCPCCKKTLNRLPKLVENPNVRLIPNTEDSGQSMSA